MDQMKKLYIEASSRCNYNCTMCFRKTWIGEKFADLPWESFMNAMNTMPDSVETVFFGGMGEPLIHPRILDMVRVAHGLGKRTEIISNGTLLHERNLMGLMNAGIDMIWISIDSFDPDKYDSIQQNGKYETIMRNIEALNRLRTIEKKNDNEQIYTVLGKPDLGITFVAMKSNVSELGMIANFANSIQAQKVNISNVLPSDEASMKEALYPRLINKEWHAQIKRTSRPEIYLPLMDWDNEDTIHAMASIMTSQSQVIMSGSPIIRNKQYCKFIEEGNCFVRYDGNVTACMGLLHSCTTIIWDQKRTIHHKSFGNMADGNLKDIWESDEYYDFRQRVLNFSFSPCVICGGCHFRDSNEQDCLGNTFPTCGACLWSEGIIVCP